MYNKTAVYFNQQISGKEIPLPHIGLTGFPPPVYYFCASISAYQSTMLDTINEQRIMLKHRLAEKCPFLDKFVALSHTPCRGGFLSIQDAHKEFSAIVALWTDGDSVMGTHPIL